MTWFRDLTGIAPETPQNVYQHLRLDGDALVSDINGARIGVGSFSMPSLAQLRSVGVLARGPTTLREVVADVQDLHLDPANAGALFQVASQFNMLEMIEPDVTPADGVGRYEIDHTQGPACAIACGGGTIWRNYFMPLDGGVGQCGAAQLDGLADIGAALGNDRYRFWSMRNGYALPEPDGLQWVSDILARMNAEQIDTLRGALRVGVHHNVDVTLAGAQHAVSQIYCSAMPVAYSEQPAGLWQPLASLVLEAAYEACLLAACQNAAATGNPVVYLTLLGGGAFGNRSDWIMKALVRAMLIVQSAGLDVRIVSYGRADARVGEVIAGFEDGM